MVRIVIKNLKLKCIIGLLEFERKAPQCVLVNALFEADEFFDYALACEDITRILKVGKFETVEMALQEIATHFKQKYRNLRYQKVEILKITIIENADVGAYIEENY